MSVFVKLLPKAKRSQSEVFYVAVADKGDKPKRRNHAYRCALTAQQKPHFDWYIILIYQIITKLNLM